MANRLKKRDHEKVAKTSISMPPKLYDFAWDKVRCGGFSGLSDYLQSLVREDIQRSSPQLQTS